MNDIKLLSFLEFKNETDVDRLSTKLSDLGIPKKKFVQAALGIAKSVQHLVPEAHKDSANLCIETVEKFLRGEATEKECRIASASASAAYAAFSAAYAARAANAANAAADAAADAAANAVAAAALFREWFPWNQVCGYQIAKVLNRTQDEEFIRWISQNKLLVSYATMILSESSMHPNFEFFITEFLKKSL